MALSLLTLVAFLAAVLTVAGVYSLVSDLFLRDRMRINQRVEEEFTPRISGAIKKSPLFKDLGKYGAEAIHLDRTAITLFQKFEELVEQSGLPISPRQLLSLALFFGLGAGALTGAVLYLLRGGLISLVWTLVATLAGFTLPLWYVRLRRNRRREKLLEQLPDALDLMARAVRAGQTMAQALQAIADEFQAPIGPEFASCYDQQNLGLPADLAFQDMARRTGLLEIKIFVLAMNVQRQTGGNLAELLEKLATVVRDRFRVRGKIKVLTAEGRIQAWVLLAMPPLVFLLMMLVNRAYTEVLLEHSGCLGLMAISMALGTVWIRRIVNFDF